MRPVYGCMGPDTSHAEPLANRITSAVLSSLSAHGFTRPASGSLVVRGGEKWDAEVEKIRSALREMIELDAAAKF